MQLGLLVTLGLYWVPPEDTDCRMDPWDRT
jgi:hypothetical protein